MRRQLELPKRVIVAADYKPKGRGSIYVKRQVLDLADELSPTGVVLKANSAARAFGYMLGHQVHEKKLQYFLDAKLNDILTTIETDGELLAELSPAMLTAMCSMGVASMAALKAALPNTMVLGVTLLTDLVDKDAKEIHGLMTAAEAVSMLALRAKEAGLDGVIASPKEAAMLRKLLGDDMYIFTPGVRPKWYRAANDDQQRVATPYVAIKDGADGVVIGRPVTTAKSPCDATMWTSDEVEQALAA